MNRPRFNKAACFQPAFVICAAVLGLAGAGMTAARQELGLYVKKEPLPLKKRLSEMDEAKLAPYQVAAKQSIDNPEVLKKLGTQDYIQWVLEDPRVSVDSSVRRVLLFVTYYPLPDRVPHVPEECYAGSGYHRVATNGVTFRIDASGGVRSVPGRYLLFGASAGNALQGGGQFPVLYLFRVNGEYAGDRDGARLALNKDLFRRHAYFCKIELVFNQGYVAPTRAAATEAGERLLSVLLPLLEQEHWPD
ncbi:MAG: hypothetical protein JW955_14410 [Sedimentisphaerales bacterium]|nr:hypothetical protein [Sedimentisphaerales bacterium]